jgi:hypothetical protein
VDNKGWNVPFRCCDIHNILMIKNEDVLLELWHDYRSWHAPSVAFPILYQAFLMAGLTSVKVSPHLVVHGPSIFRGCGLCLSVPWKSRNFILLFFEFQYLWM